VLFRSPQNPKTPLINNLNILKYNINQITLIFDFLVFLK